MAGKNRLLFAGIVVLIVVVSIDIALRWPFKQAPGTGPSVGGGSPKPAPPIREVLININERAGVAFWEPEKVDAITGQPLILKVYNQLKVSRCVEINPLTGKSEVKAQSSMMVSFIAGKAGDFVIGCSEFAQDKTAKLAVTAPP